ncbi:MAG: hypothetical protein JXA33_10230 [Anaerolineae bacterium]|nr:hypothetical protein [Anaerolineae bacterium]
MFARPGIKTDVWIKTFLAFCFAWYGIVFFLIFVRNPISMSIGALDGYEDCVLFVSGVYGLVVLVKN